MSKIVFLILESSYLIRRGLASLINEVDNCEVMAELNDSQHLFSVINEYNPHVIFINLEFLNNLEEKQLKNIKNESDCKFIGIIKDESGNINPFTDDTIFYSDDKSSLAVKLNTIVESIIHEHGIVKPNNDLSEREKDVVALVAKGLTNKKIANDLFISIHTVITHRKNITRKLGIKTVSGITVYAILNKLIDMKDLN